MQVAVKASIDEQFATLAASIFAGRNRRQSLSAVLKNLTMNRAPATAATRLGSRTAGGGAAAGSAHRGGVFTVVGQEKKLNLEDRWHRKYE